ncbi:MAG TPA: SulP family inorganic anion transporter [Actinomycetota bacterium]|nr:SulP family inorganic anion transporter [Actinomycetota bacterium]
MGPGLDDRGVDVVGHIDSGLPSLGLPEVAAADYLALAPSAIGVMPVGFAEGPGPAKTYAARHHDGVDADRELLGLGAANLAAGLSSGMVVNGSLSKTAVNGSAGARSQVSGLVVAALAVLGQVPGADGHYGDILRHPENRHVPGIVVLRLEGGLYFANADAVRDAIRAHAAEPSVRAVVLDAETIPYVDVTAARMLMQLGGDLEREAIAALTRRP